MSRLGCRPRVVALGGGHGLAASLTALRQVTDRLTAIVTVADDGGSSGRLRTELGLLPPGDLRMALTALAADAAEGTPWADVLQHRFDAGGLAGHPVGNLLLAGLLEVLDDPVAALDAVGEVVGARGRVLPLSPDPLDIVAEVIGLDGPRGGLDGSARISGQVAVATTAGQVVSVHLVPERPRVCPEVLTAITEADAVVFGPGSWFTSVLPHLLVPAVRSALIESEASVILAVNLSAQPGETEGFSPETHLEVFAAYAPDLPVDVVVADRGAVPDVYALRTVAESLGARVVLDEVALPDGTARHDPVRLAAAYGRILGAGESGGEGAVDGDDRDGQG